MKISKADLYIIIIVLLNMFFLLFEDSFSCVLKLITILLSSIILAVAFYLMVKDKIALSDKILMALSIINFIPSIFIAVYYFTGKSTWLNLTSFINKEYFISWVVYTLAISITAACINKKYFLWYLMNVIVGVFILYSNKNILGIIYICVCFVLIALIKKDKDTLKYEIIIFSCCVCIFCLMAPIIHYLSPLSTGVDYSINLSREIEFYWSLFLAFFLLFGNRIYRFITDKRKHMIKERYIFLSIISAFFVIVVIVALYQIIAMGMVDKIFTYIKTAMDFNNNIFIIFFKSIGYVGIILLGFWIFCVILILFNARVINHHLDSMQKTSFVLTLMYILQFIIFPQTLEITIFYFLFICYITKSFFKQKFNLLNK